MYAYLLEEQLMVDLTANLKRKRKQTKLRFQKQ